MKSAQQVIRIALAASAALLVVGCSGNAPSEPTNTPTPQATGWPDESQMTPAPAGATVDHDHGVEGHPEESPQIVTPRPLPTGDVDRSQATELGAEFMRRWAADLPKDQWWGPVSELLSPQGQKTYESVDPANIDVTEVGPAKSIPSDSEYLGRVHVETNKGTYLVVLTRYATNEWQVDHIVMPEEDPHAGNEIEGDQHG